MADVIWRALGDPKHYIEPFCGSAAVLLARPHTPRNEIIGDLDCYLVNFWRSLKHDPAGVADHARHLNSQSDMHARHRYLLDARHQLKEKISIDPEYCDAKIAGYWVYGLSLWFGHGWTDDTYRDSHRRQQLMKHQGVFAGCRRDLLGLFRRLSDRLERVVVINHSWSQTCSIPSMIVDDCGIFFDPPYSGEVGRNEGLYAEENLVVSHDVRRWCIEHQTQCKIVLAGYIGEHNELESHGWRVHAWSTQGGLGHLGGENSRGKSNRHKERLWISPLCGGVEQKG
ncbi:MAG: DNA adenine methylase [Patescibacteria group bacterium]|nr:DNA adenine methylase [Patescibacteria group bacterium]